MSKTNLFDLDGKIAFVSGASRGIGEAIAKLLAQQGAHVIVSSRKIETAAPRVETSARSIRSKRRSIGSSTFCAAISTARREATRASGPCPSPSATTTSM